VTPKTGLAGNTRYTHGHIGDAINENLSMISRLAVEGAGSSRNSRQQFLLGNKEI